MSKPPFLSAHHENRKAQNDRQAAKPPRSIAASRRQARSCRDCALWKHATQTVFGEGSPKARVVLVGAESGPDVLVTVHPSYLLRMPSEDRQRAYAAFVADLRHMESYL